MQHINKHLVYPPSPFTLSNAQHLKPSHVSLLPNSFPWFNLHLLRVFFGWEPVPLTIRTLAISASTIKLNFLISPYVLETLIAGCKIYCTKRFFLRPNSFPVRVCCFFRSSLHNDARFYPCQISTESLFSRFIYCCVFQVLSPWQAFIKLIQ